MDTAARPQHTVATGASPARATRQGVVAAAAAAAWTWVALSRCVLQRHHIPGRELVRGQKLLLAERVPERRRRVLRLRPRRLDGRRQARDRCLLRERRARDQPFLLHQRDQRREPELLRVDQHAVAVRGGAGLLRAGPAADLVELQLRAGGAEHRLRRAREPGRGGAGPHDLVQDGALVLDEQRARGDAPGVRRHHQGHQWRRRV